MRKKILRSALFLLLLTVAALPLSAQPRYKGAGYGFLAFGGNVEGNSESLTSLGGGGEAVFNNGLGFRMDVGFFGPIDNLSAGIGALSPGMLYEFTVEKKTSAFVGGGYTLFFRDDTLNGIHFGGGVRHWFTRGFGIRVEARDEVPLIDGRSFHNVFARFSFLFR
ncbi:MAG TPA: hypothetical protein VLU25_04160 [Acidobacteriota bacterium]|nr:hypothetical protein [Acidobacteriota bacterium]